MPETKRKDGSNDANIVVDKLAAKDTINYVKVQCLFPAHVKYEGAISGQLYDFPGPGSVLEVDSRDVSAMLAYRIGTTNCCGGGNIDGNRVFQLA